MFTVLSVPDSFPKSSFSSLPFVVHFLVLSSIFQVVSFIIWSRSSICQLCSSDLIRCSSIKWSTFSRLAFSQLTSLECICWSQEEEELEAILFRNLDLGPNQDLLTTSNDHFDGPTSIKDNLRLLILVKITFNDQL